MLAQDARVTRVTEQALDDLWEAHGYDKTIYIWLRTIPEYMWSRDPLPDHLAIRLKYSFGNAGGYRYDFAIWSDSNDDLHVRMFLVAMS